MKSVFAFIDLKWIRITIERVPDQLDGGDRWISCNDLTKRRDCRWRGRRRRRSTGPDGSASTPGSRRVARGHCVPYPCRGGGVGRPTASIDVGGIRTMCRGIRCQCSLGVGHQQSRSWLKESEFDWVQARWAIGRGKRGRIENRVLHGITCIRWLPLNGCGPQRHANGTGCRTPGISDPVHRAASRGGSVGYTSPGIGVEGRSNKGVLFSESVHTCGCQPDDASWCCWSFVGLGLLMFAGGGRIAELGRFTVADDCTSSTGCPPNGLLYILTTPVRTTIGWPKCARCSVHAWSVVRNANNSFPTAKKNGFRSRQISSTMISSTDGFNRSSITRKVKRF